MNFAAFVHIKPQTTVERSGGGGMRVNTVWHQHVDGAEWKKKRLCEGRLLCHLSLHSESLRFMNGS